MPSIDKNVIKMSKILHIDLTTSEKIYDAMALSDLVSLTIALSNDDVNVVKKLYDKYKEQVENAPSVDEIRDYYNTQLELVSDENEAIEMTSEHFDTSDSDVKDALETPIEDKSAAIHDEKVTKAVESVNRMIEGKPTRKVISELNQWQRKQMYGLIPKVTASIIQKILDLTPLGLMKKQAEISGKDELIVSESNMSLSDMVESILSHELRESAIQYEETLDESVCEDCNGIETSKCSTCNPDCGKKKLTAAQEKLIKSIAGKEFK